MKRGPKKFLSTTGGKRNEKKKTKKRNNINKSKDESRRRSNKLHKHDLDAHAPEPELRICEERQRASERAIRKP
jgi:hypothetical protein